MGVVLLTVLVALLTVSVLLLTVSEVLPSTSEVLPTASEGQDSAWASTASKTMTSLTILAPSKVVLLSLESATAQSTPNPTNIKFPFNLNLLVFPYLSVSSFHGE